MSSFHTKKAVVALLVAGLAATSNAQKPTVPADLFKSPFAASSSLSSESEMAAAEAIARRALSKSAEGGLPSMSFSTDGKTEIGKVVLPTYGAVFAPVTVIVDLKAPVKTTKPKDEKK